MRSAIALATVSAVLVSCAASEVSTPPESPTAATTPMTPEPSAARSPAPTGDRRDVETTSPTHSPPLGADLVVDGLAEVIVEDLTLRSEPGIGAARVGLLPLGEPAYVVAGPVEADGYLWYQLGSVRQPYRGSCGDPAPEPSLECAEWFGWAAGVTPDADRWLRVRDQDCPAARDTEAYLALLPAERLACAGSAEWRLTAYVAPSTGGRGCFPVYVVDPGWLDPTCNMNFLQPEETEYDSFEGLQVFVHPSCTLDAGSPCAFETVKGSWVEVVGHLDDPVAPSCDLVLSSNFEDAPYPAPSLDEIDEIDRVVFGCRTRFVATEVKTISASGG